MKKKVSISVILPAYNEERLISRCLSSLTKQDFLLPFEIIVVNNNSTDQTATIVKSFPDVKLINENVPGIIQARQKGLLAAQAEIVVSADCDCVYPQNWLSNLYKHFANPQVVAVGGPAIGETNPWWAHLIYKFGFRFVGFVYRTTKRVIYLGGFNFAYRRGIFLKAGGYRTYLDSGADEIEPLIRLSKLGRVIFDPQAFMYVSLRRYRVGFLRWFFIHHSYYYVLNFVLAMLFKKTFIRTKPVRNI